jgi:hypothetical protein
LLSRLNATTLGALAFGAIAVGSGIFLILELSQPYTGRFKISPAMTTNPGPWRTTRSAAMAAIYSAALCFRLRPSNFKGEGNRLGEVARIGGRQIVRAVGR